MSYIPDCRRDEYYNQKFLGGYDREFMRGFDWCAEEAVDNFFDNNYDDDTGEYLAHILTQKVPECLREKYTMEYTFGDRPDEERTIETYADLIRFELLHWIEMQRNEMITGMIDSMSQEEYASTRGICLQWRENRIEKHGVMWFKRFMARFYFVRYAHDVKLRRHFSSISRRA